MEGIDNNQIKYIMPLECAARKQKVTERFEEGVGIFYVSGQELLL